MIRSCSTCQWWLPRGHDEGECRGAPPSVVCVGSGNRTVWPTTRKGEFCAAWQMHDGVVEQSGRAAA